MEPWWGPSLEELKEDRLDIPNFHSDMKDEENNSFLYALLRLPESEETLELLREMVGLDTIDPTRNTETYVDFQARLGRVITNR